LLFIAIIAVYCYLVVETSKSSGYQSDVGKANSFIAFNPLPFIGPGVYLHISTQHQSSVVLAIGFIVFNLLPLFSI
jgi:hypothetical protein